MWNEFLLVITLMICVVTDLRERKIYNKVLFPVLAIALVGHMVSNGLEGALYSLMGTLVGLSLLLIPYFLGGMGAGDVKLLAVIGALQGTSFVLVAAVYMAVFGGLIAIGVLLFHRGTKKRLLGVGYFLNGLRTGVVMPVVTGESALKKTYPYGVAIAAGAVLQLVYPYGGSL